MKLYYSPGACSLAPHIVIKETGITAELEKVDLRNGRYAGGDFKQVNPKGYVPTLELDNGEILTEGAVIMQYLSAQKPETNLAPPGNDMEHYRFLELLNFIATEIHKGFGVFWSDAPDSYKNQAKDRLGQRFDFLNRQLTGKQYLMGEQFTAADAYLFAVLSWTNIVKIDLKPWTAITKFMERVAQRPAVQAAMREEGLIK